jgi:hypothetical protein
MKRKEWELSMKPHKPISNLINMPFDHERGPQIVNSGGVRL